MRLTLDLEGTEQLRGTLAKLREAGEDPRPAFDEVADYFVHLNSRAFATRGRAIGVRWRPLSKLYRKYRRPLPAGVQTGVLRRSMTTKGARHHRRRVTSRYVEVKSVAPHAHLYSDGRGGQPARRLVNIRRADRKEIVGILQRHLTGDL